MVIDLYGASNRRSNYYNCREATLRYTIMAKVSTSFISPTGVISKFAKSIFNPKTTYKHKKYSNDCRGVHSQPHKRSSYSLLLNPANKSDKGPLSIVADIILLSAFITITNNKDHTKSPSKSLS